MKTFLQTAAARSCRIASFGLGLALMVSAVAGSAHAEFKAPEVDPGSLASALTLLTGGVLTLTGPGPPGQINASGRDSSVRPVPWPVALVVAARGAFATFLLAIRIGVFRLGSHLGFHSRRLVAPSLASGLVGCPDSALRH